MYIPAWTGHLTVSRLGITFRGLTSAHGVEQFWKMGRMGIEVFEFTFSIESDEKIVEKLCSFKKAKYRQQFSNSDKLMKIAVFQRLKK